MSVLKSVMQKTQIKNLPDFSSLTSRESIFLNLINQNPGIRYLELKTLTGFNNGVVSHYLRQLESSGLIKSVRTPRVSCFYPLSLSELSQKIFRRSRQITPQRIILALIKKNHSFLSLVNEVKKSPSTVSTYATKLIHDDIVAISYDNSKKIFKINPKIYDQLIYTLKINT
jgi:predicted transcriptional regulator